MSREIRAIQVAIACAAVGAATKLVAGAITGSMTMISSAVDSLGDLMVSLGNLFVVRFAQGDEQAGGQALVGHEERCDAAASTTGAGQDALREHLSEHEARTGQAFPREHCAIDVLPRRRGRRGAGGVGVPETFTRPEVGRFSLSPADTVTT